MKNMEEKLKADAKHAKSIGQNSKIKLLSDVLSHPRRLSRRIGPQQETVVP